MTQTNEILSASKTLDITEHRRFSEEELAILVMANNNWLGVTPHFSDRSELLNLTQLHVMTEYNHNKGMPLNPEAILAEDSPVKVLSRRLSGHAIARNITFKSMFNDADALAIRNSEQLMALQRREKPYVFPGFTDEVVLGIYDGVKTKIEERTHSLLVDFERDYDALGDQPVWLDIAISPQGNQNVYAAQLAGFAIRGSNEHTLIEPVVFNTDSERGLLPARGVYVQPELKIRV